MIEKVYTFPCPEADLPKRSYLRCFWLRVQLSLVPLLHPHHSLQTCMAKMVHVPKEKQHTPHQTASALDVLPYEYDEKLRYEISEYTMLCSEIRIILPRKTLKIVIRVMSQFIVQNEMAKASNISEVYIGCLGWVVSSESSDQLRNATYLANRYGPEVTSLCPFITVTNPLQLVPRWTCTQKKRIFANTPMVAPISRQTNNVNW